MSALSFSPPLYPSLTPRPKHSFLHPHWWLDKLAYTGSSLQLVNGVLLLLSSVFLSLSPSPSPSPAFPLRADPSCPTSRFFTARIAYGGYMTYVLWFLLENPRVSPALRWGFRAANLALNGESSRVESRSRILSWLHAYSQPPTSIPNPTLNPNPDSPPSLSAEQSSIGPGSG